MSAMRTECALEGRRLFAHPSTRRECGRRAVNLRCDPSLTSGASMASVAPVAPPRLLLLLVVVVVVVAVVVAWLLLLVVVVMTTVGSPAAAAARSAVEPSRT